MSARRDALLFFAMALVPSLAIGLLGQRAIQNEGAARERELTVSAAQEASGIARRLQDGVEREAERLRPLSGAAGASHEALYQRARDAAPDFSEPIVVGGDGRIILPKASTKPSSAATDGACQDDAAALTRTPSAARRAAILARCEEARDDAERWLWPVLAQGVLMEKQDEALLTRLVTWLEDHAARMSPEEISLSRSDAAAIDRTHPGARQAIERALAGGGRGRPADVGIAAGAERTAAFRAAVRASLVTKGEPRTFAGDGHFGAIVASDTDEAYGFVVSRESLLSSDVALAARDPRFVSSALQTRELDVRGPSAYVALTDGLGVAVRLRDPDAIDRERRRTELVLYALLTLGVALAVVLSFALFRRMRETRRTSELRTSFVAGVSHELRTPLASIRMLSELLSEDRVDDAERREVLDALTNEAVRLTTTVERFLAYAKSERGKLVPEPVLTDLDALVGDRVSAFRHRTGAAVEFERGGGAERISCDPRQLEIVVDNLLENAKKYAADGEPYRVELTFSAESTTLAVDDGGPGVEPAAARRIFKAFERGDDRLSSAVSGTGLGLFLVRTIAEAHGGDVRLTRSSRGGARFTVRIPRMPHAERTS